MGVLMTLGWIILCLIGLVTLLIYIIYGYMLVRYLVDEHKEKKLKKLKGKGG